MKKLIFRIFILFVLVSCSKEEVATDNVNIRLFNVGEVEFQDIKFSPSAGIVSFGDLAPDQYSEYKNFNRAYRYAYISLTVNDSMYALQPVDYVGETPLTNGNYTYRLNFNNDDKLTFVLVED